ncbi:hypothetical protein D3Z47_02320 [Lachnospiraceae bacterium]|nr:hypothetical protein [Lachnospiraceae bacterium]
MNAEDTVLLAQYCSLPPEKDSFFGSSVCGGTVHSIFSLFTIPIIFTTENNIKRIIKNQDDMSMGFKNQIPENLNIMLIVFNSQGSVLYFCVLS